MNKSRSQFLAQRDLASGKTEDLVRLVNWWRQDGRSVAPMAEVSRYAVELAALDVVRSKHDHGKRHGLVG